jgi:hypothetical protein
MCDLDAKATNEHVLRLSGRALPTMLGGFSELEREALRERVPGGLEPVRRPPTRSRYRGAARICLFTASYQYGWAG